jgi:anti-sigma factor RsiW
MEIDSELACKEFVELVTDYLEGAMPAADRERLEQHLGGCRGCRTYLEQIRQTVRLTGRLTEESLSEEVRQELMEIFRSYR